VSNFVIFFFTLQPSLEIYKINQHLWASYVLIETKFDALVEKLGPFDK
jgi:hypothetical protein